MEDYRLICESQDFHKWNKTLWPIQWSPGFLKFPGPTMKISGFTGTPGKSGTNRQPVTRNAQTLSGTLWQWLALLSTASPSWTDLRCKWNDVFVACTPPRFYTVLVPQLSSTWTLLHHQIGRTKFISSVLQGFWM